MSLNNASERLSQNRQRIIDLWETRAIQEVRPAHGLSSLLLRNGLEEFLEKLSESLSKSGKMSQERLVTESKTRGQLIGRHGAMRAKQVGYALYEVILEFHILRQVLFEVLEETAPLKPQDRDTILDVIEQAVNDAANAFSDAIKDLQDYFSVTLTHDLRGPLTSSKTAAQLILRNPDRRGQVEKCAFRIVESMDRMDQMIHDILNASKLKAGEDLPISITEFDLVALVLEVVDEFQMLHPDRFVANVPKSIIGCWSYEGIRRVLQNLLTNALKYGTFDSPITVTLEEGDDSIKVAVHNLGNPIPPEKQASLFEFFKQIQTTPGKSGWGLGLFLVKGIVEAHGGSIDLRSTRDEGTRFIVSLPRTVREPKAVSA